MASEPTPDNLNSLQWAITTVGGLFIAGYGLLLKWLHEDVAELKKKQDEISEKAMAHAGKGDDSLWTALEELRKQVDTLVSKEDFRRLQNMLEEDRKHTATDRANIAVMMATKNELERQLDRHFNRLVDALGERGELERRNKRK